MFGLDYFGRRACLAQSPQLYKQVMVGVFERVYETGPAFCSEPHDTLRHLAEYVSLDAGLGFIRDHRDIEVVLHDVLAGMVAAVETRAADAVSLLGLDLPLVPAEIPRIHFRDAQTLLETATGEQIVGEPDLAPAHERWLGEWALTGYLEAFRHGMPPHGGFAIGLERWTARIVGVPNVRQFSLFPRDRNRLTP